MKSISYILTIIFFAMFTKVCAAKKDPYTKGLEALSKGHTFTATEQLSEVLFDEENKVKLGKTYALLAIAYTFHNDKPKEKCENLLFVIPEDMQESIGATFVKYVLGKTSATNLEDTIRRSDYNWKAAGAIARYAIVLRNHPNLESLKTIADEYKKYSSNLGGKEWGNTWTSRIDKWQDWVNQKTKQKYGLEKLITADRDFKKMSHDIATLTEEEYEAMRKIYVGRPKEVSLNFDDKQVARYINSLPENLQKMERARLNTVMSIKTYIIRVLERSPYPNGIQTKRRKIRGTITMANKNYIVYKKSTRSRKSERVYWKDLKYEQYSDMMEYYGNRRMKMTGAGKKTAADMKKDAANDFFGAAILCDWFGDHKNALRFAKETIKNNPAMKDSVSRMLLE